ncbi:amidinotransferase [Cordyceps fumosorosea ARSEF 2679]|uniref:Glycine amidinotransferase, mitochondrial n=1 Tax=Cordyceps fumosorosea (strain ARSEF 2679) TaxID=1081104 RepID=A0A168CMN1_CORFA|nr:amidinotransferase [Cordyceps fumosorosea ARSEF 2679]OAA71566.1 amidinotransferase [Cordyceps fumosorosea ARSEF 2679]
MNSVSGVASNGMLVNAENEWSPLKAVIVGRAEHSCYPNAPQHLMGAIMPRHYLERFRPHSPFSPEIVKNAQKELDRFACVLQQYGVKVYRPDEVDWLKHGGYTGAMPRDRLMTVGNRLIESIPAWDCRQKEIELAYSTIMSQFSHPEEAGWHVFRQPVLHGRNTIHDGKEEWCFDPDRDWAVNDSRPAFDAADFMRFGKYIIGQPSHVTNQKGIDYLRAMLPAEYTLEIIKPEYPSVMHIDATLLPLRKGLLVYNPTHIGEGALRQLKALEGWEMHAYHLPKNPARNPNLPNPEQPIVSGWIVLNGLSLDEKHIFLEEQSTDLAEWIKDKFGMEPILLPFKHVNSLGGSFHCATVDLVRD